jgi:CheY-like chemotaxis protein
LKYAEGIGLGLAITKKIANALGGEILVKSAKGKGSTFTFRVPINNLITQEEIEVEEIHAPKNNTWAGKTILIAEDVETNFYYLKDSLKKTKTNILWAKNGEEALKLAYETQKIDLILMDIKMPIMDGYEAAKKIKEHNPKQIIVAQTAYSRPEERTKYDDYNFDDYLAKPINRMDLLLILEKFL